MKSTTLRGFYGHRPKVLAYLITACFSLACANLAQAALPTMANGQPLPTLAPMLEKTVPGVVNIATLSKVSIAQNPLMQDPMFRRFFKVPESQPYRDSQSAGSGVIVDAKEGLILTNAHVIENADEVTVTLSDGRNFSAEILGKDVASDVAVIKIEASRLQAIPLADSNAVKVGDFVVAIGNPFGLGNTVTSGIVSALGRTGIGQNAQTGYQDFIQTDASINPGNSGGALVNLNGELVGINTAILTRSGGNLGIGFAIPSDLADQVMAQLIQYGEVSRGRLGIQIQNLTPDLAEAFGLKNQTAVIIGRIDPDSAAERAGLKIEDIILSINGKKVSESKDIRNVVGLTRVGESVTMEILRNGKRQTITAVISEANEGSIKAETVHAKLTGALFSEITEDHPLHGKIEGIQVAEIKPQTAATRTGLAPGDIITSVNRKPVSSLKTFKNIVDASKSDNLLLHIQRGQTSLFLLLK